MAVLHGSRHYRGVSAADCIVAAAREDMIVSTCRTMWQWCVKTQLSVHLLHCVAKSDIMQ